MTILDKYRADERIAKLRDFLGTSKAPDRLLVKSLVASARAVAVAAVGVAKNVVVCAERDAAPYLYHDLCCLLGSQKVFFLPSSFRHAPKSDGYDAQNVQLRTEALAHFASDSEVTIVTYAAAMAEKVPSTASVKNDFITLRRGDKISLSFLVDTLLEYGFERSDFVYAPGQFSVRGSIVDLFSFATDSPTRVDFFGDEIDTLRSFDLESQLSTDKIESVNVVPDLGRVDKPSSLTPFSQSIPPDAALWMVDDDAVRDMLNAQYDAVTVAASKDDTDPDGAPLSIDLFCTADQWDASVACPRIVLANAKGEADIDFQIVGQPLFKKNFDLLEDDIYYKSADGYQVFILSDNSRQLQRLRSILGERKRKLNYSEMQLSLHGGFVDKSLRLCFYTDHQIFERFQRFSLRNDGTCTDSNITDKVIEVTMVIGVEHFVRTSEACFAERTHMKLTNGDDTLDKVGLFIGIGLVKHTLVAVSCGTGFTCVDTGNDEDLVLYFLLNIAESGDVIKNAVFAVCGAGTDDENEFVGFTCEYLFDFFVAFRLDCFKIGGDGVLFFDLLRNRKFTDEVHVHNHLPSFVVILNYSFLSKSARLLVECRIILRRPSMLLVSRRQRKRLSSPSKRVI